MECSKKDIALKAALLISHLCKCYGLLKQHCIQSCCVAFVSLFVLLECSKQTIVTWLTGSLVGLLAGLLAGWLADWLAGWLIG